MQWPRSSQDGTAQPSEEIQLDSDSDADVPTKPFVRSPQEASQPGNKIKSPLKPANNPLKFIQSPQKAAKSLRRRKQPSAETAGPGPSFPVTLPQGIARQWHQVRSPKKASKARIANPQMSGHETIEGTAGRPRKIAKKEDVQYLSASSTEAEQEASLSP